MGDVRKEINFEVGEWLVEPDSNRLGKDGEMVMIEPRVMELLVYLAKHPGKVVSSEEIFDHVWPNVVVGENSIYRCIAQIRKVLGDSTTEPRYIATIPKRGYQLIADVKAAAPRPRESRESAASAAPVGAENGRTRLGARLRSHGPWILAGMLLVVVVVVGSLVIPRSEAPRVPGEDAPFRLTSIAVLPFNNVSDDPNNDYFAIGLSDEILNTLGHVHGLDVVARTSSYSLEGTEDVREIGRLLNVEGVVEGGVRKAGNEIRVHVQLIDAASGFDMWAGEYDRQLNDVFVIQEEIAESILDALGEQLGIALATDVQSPDVTKFEAYDLYLLGRHYVRGRDPVELKRAAELFRNATEQDENYAPAFSGLAEAYLLQAEYGDFGLDQAVQLAEPMLDRALALDADFAEPYATRGLARFLERRHEEAQAALGTALQINPNNAMANMWLALSLAYDDGRIGDALPLYERGLSLDPLNVTLVMNLAYNLSRLGRYGEALDRLEALSELNPESVRIQLGIAQAATDFGKFDVAHRAASRALELKPDSARAMTMLAYIYASLGDVPSAEDWIARVEQSGDKTSHWYLNVSRTAVYLEKGEIEELAAFLNSLIEQAFKPDPLLFYSPRQWQAYGAAGVGQMLLGDYPAAAKYFERHLQAVRTVGMTQTSEDDLVFLTNDAYVRRQMGDQEGSRAALAEAAAATVRAREYGWDTNKLRFDEARLHALRGESRKAVAALEEAVDRGFSWLWWLEHDPVWADVAEDDSFRQIVARMEENQREMLARIQ